ncbi:chromosome segregation protein SMC [Sinimarinibacterium sp. NLF-5-8]|uniref:chromosome segregation protein SMC n=1 Tax=Sinimarinibacterium sp. NLF-5-8 TaxID=2698684 RepID=UPI00137BA85E|nr:chromosome segregation protein SMC [Sinimarinibacterium sp. NLF-5-8]QHS09873.1 chromosome segregation protein SMC [Sinimarinibacterium sp. NLF-5-8]
MRLSGIKLAGFKSFVDPMQLPLAAHLTGVVGPNGCGKSNIIDAVRWVLGETSMKNLRSAEAEDVIFNGSKTRKPVGRASVELLFDNSDGSVAGVYAAYNEISVRRELTRDGGSQYYLNGAKCLKRDVTDLFLGTGLGGKNQYAIIEQGTVSRMIEAKPEELRQWLEEAAGISKYKERRRETESRIRQTRDNLARLNDLRAELTQRLEVLTRQAANAEKYKDAKTEERQLKAEILALRARAFEAQGAAFDARIAELEAAFEQARARVNQLADARIDAEVESKALANRLSDEQSKVYEAEAALARQQQGLQHAQQLQQLKVRELEQLTRQLAELSQRQQREQQRLAQAQQELTALGEQAEQAEQDAETAQAALIEAEEDAQEEQARWDAFVQDAEAPLTQTEAERVRVQQLERARFQSEERQRRLQSEYAQLNIEPIRSSLEEADAQLEQLNGELDSADEQLREMDEALHSQRDRRSVLEADLHQTREQLQAARGRVASLETLQQAALKQDDAELNGWLRQQAMDTAPRLASVLQVEPGWETAVEQALVGWLQAPVLDDYSARAITDPPKAGISVLAAARARGEHGLASKVSGPAAIVALLHGIQTASDLDEARARLPDLAAHESIITAQGQWLGAQFQRHPQQGQGSGGVIARTQLLRELKQQVQDQQQQVLDLEAELGALRAQIHSAEQQRRERSAHFDQLRHRQAQKLAFRQAQQVRLEQTQQRAQALSDEIETLAISYEQQSEELHDVRARLLALESAAQDLRQKRAQMQQVLQQKRDAVSRLRHSASQVAQARGQVQVQLAGRSSSVSGIERALAELAERHEALQIRLDEEQHNALELAEPLEHQAEDVESARQAVDSARQTLRAVREEVEAAERVLQQTLHTAHAADQHKDLAQEQLQGARIEYENLRAHRQSLDEQISETGFDRAHLFENLAADATLANWEDRLGVVSRRIERLGAINLAAIDELTEARARDTYLTEQHADLHGALEVLEEAIRKIDAETREMFKVTFDKVNDVFKDRFPKLFGGGEAYLELTGENLLDAGVRVMARPPGKRNSTIHLLSGGEKAMTAVALLLALFQLNPAPFCLMDEVDAPLDDANVGRFCEIVREMSHNVQFIIITHNKITMELAQQLHGVTMQEPGVSRLVSVDIQQAVDLVTEQET